MREYKEEQATVSNADQLARRYNSPRLSGFSEAELLQYAQMLSLEACNTQTPPVRVPIDAEDGLDSDELEMLIGEL